MTITRDQTAKIADAVAAQYGDDVMVDFCMRYGNPSTESKVQGDGCGGLREDPVLPAVSALRGRHLGHRE